MTAKDDAVTNPGEDRATAKPPAPMGKRDVGKTPGTVAGALPENVGHDPADVNRTLTAAEQRDRDVVSFLNRVIMLEQHGLQTLQDLRNREVEDGTRNKLTELIDDDRRAIEVLERAVRDLNGRVNPVRKTSGLLLAKARSLMEDIPGRARRAVEQRDFNAMREEPPFQRMLDYTDAYVGELTTAAHWDVLKEMADAMDHQGLKDAVNECRDGARAHAEYLKNKIPEAARDAVARANVAQSP